MSGELISQETIDALVAATNAARHVISQAHEATRDLRQVVVEARTLIRTETEGRVREALKAEVAGQVEQLGAVTQEAMDAAVAKVGREFRRIERIYLGLEDDGKPSLEALTHKAAAFRKAGP